MVQYANSVNQNLICSICQQPFEDPVTLLRCDHTFCRQCLQQHVDSAAAAGNGDQQVPLCPLDRQSFSPADDCKQANIIVRNMVDELIVFCDNYTRIRVASSDGGDDNDSAVEITSIHDPVCRWTGQRILLASHLEHYCPVILHEKRQKQQQHQIIENGANEPVTVSGSETNTEMMEYLICAMNKLQSEQERIRREMDSVKLEFGQMRISPQSSHLPPGPLPHINNHSDLHSLAMENERMRGEIVQHLHSITSQQQTFLYPELANMRHQIDRLTFMFGEMHHRNYMASSVNNITGNANGNIVGMQPQSMFPSNSVPRTTATAVEGNASSAANTAALSSSTSSTVTANRQKL